MVGAVVLMEWDGKGSRGRKGAQWLIWLVGIGWMGGWRVALGWAGVE